MSEDKIFQVSCSRCGQLHETTKLEYQNNNGQTYCKECLVPFECGRCGERRYTIPENVSKGKTVICEYCMESEPDSGSGEDSPEFSYWGSDSRADVSRKLSVAVARLLALVFAAVIVLLLLFSLSAAASISIDEVNIFHIYYGYLVCISVFTGYELARISWVWEPDIGFLRYLMVLGARILGFLSLYAIPVLLVFSIGYFYSLSGGSSVLFVFGAPIAIIACGYILWYLAEALYGWPLSENS